MRRATELEIKHFITYRSNHVALVQRLGKLAFDEDMSSHDHDKIEADGETLNKWALWNAYKNGEYNPNTTKDLNILKKLVAKHVCTQKHHPEFWDVNITPTNYTKVEQVKATRMSKKSLKEMCCDWSAVALYKNQPIFEYYNKVCNGDNPRFLFTLNQKNFIIDCFTKIEKTIKDENITWLGKDYTAEQIEPLREAYCEDNYEDYNYEEIIHSTKFKEWFGDWENDPEHASKVVDSEGKPLVVYHGTRSTEEFNSFQNSYNFFTDNKDVARMFANECAYKLLVNNEETYDLDMSSAIHLAQLIEPYYPMDVIEDFNKGIDDLLDIITTEEFNDLLDTGFIQCGLNPQESYSSISICPNPNKLFCVFLNIRNPQIVDLKGKVWEKEDESIMLPKYPYDGSIINNIIEGGYGAEIDGEDVPCATDYIVTSPNQIKSINNYGNFSIVSNNIYENLDYSYKEPLNESHYSTKGYNWDKGMSNRAVQAYNDGKMPITYWKNNKVLNNAIKYEGDASDEVAKILTSLPIEAKLNLLVDNGEYHHTSKYYNVTYFYEMSDLSHVSVKDAEAFKQEWEDYSQKARDYNKFKKTITFGTQGNTEIKEDEKGIVEYTYTDYLSDCYIPDNIIAFLNNDIDMSFSGNLYIRGTKPTSNIPKDGTKRIQPYGKDTIALTQYNADTEDYEAISKFTTKASCKDLLDYSKDKYKGTVSKIYLKVKPRWTATISSTLTEILDKPKENCKYAIVAPDGQVLENTITDSLQTIKQIRRELVDKYGFVFFSITKIKESVEGCANSSDNFSSQAPEHVSRLFIPYESDVLKDFKLKEFKDCIINKLNESIIDVPQKEYYDGVLTSDDKMVPELRKQIIKTIYNWKQQINFDFDVYKILAKGSLLTKRYNDTTDLDITVYTDMTKEQLDQVYNIIPKGNKIIVDGKESSHILDIYILTKGEKTVDTDVNNIYDVAHNKWIKRSEEYDNEIPLSYALEVANFFINGCTISLSNYNNDKIMYEYYMALDPKEQEITQKEKDKAIAEVKNSLRADLDGLRLALHMVSAFRQESYGEEPNPFRMSIDILSDNPHNSLNEVMIKLIEKFGIREELRAKAEECSKLLGLNEEFLTESNKFDKTAAFVVSTISIPTIKDLLLFTKLQSISADVHFIYLSYNHDNALDYATTISLVKAMIKENNLDVELINLNTKSVLDDVLNIYNMGYKNLIFVGESNIVDNTIALIKKYNDNPIDSSNSSENETYNFDSIIGVDTGLQDSDTTDIMKYVKNKDFKNFALNFGVKDSFIAHDVYKQLQHI